MRRGAGGGGPECASRGREAATRVTEELSGATELPAAPLDPKTHTFLSSLAKVVFVFVVLCQSVRVEGHRACNEIPVQRLSA